jgi:hypothetical protein
MLAELRGKLDPDGLGGLERSEDLLTEAVFGAIRYLPRTPVLGGLLEHLNVQATPAALRNAEISLWPTVPRPSWPARVVEPDVMIRVGSRVIAFENKLYSPFDTYERDPSGSDPQLHQLAVQYHAVSAWAAGERLEDATVVAITRGPSQPTADLEKARFDIRSLGLDAADDAVRWTSWRGIAAIFESAKGLERHEAAVVEDVLALMEKRGVRRMFSGFAPEDYWLVTAAQRVAAERLYPSIRTFFEDLGAVLAEDHVGRSQPQYDAMWLGLGTGATRPVDWTRSFVARQFWPEVWPARTKQGANLALYGLFDFVTPAFEAGITIPGAGVAAAQAKWPPHLPAIAAEINALSDSYEIAIDLGDIARPARCRPAAEVDLDWLKNSLASMVTTAHFRIRQRVNPLSITVQSARELVTEVKEVLSLPAFAALLLDGGYLLPPASIGGPPT